MTLYINQDSDTKPSTRFMGHRITSYRVEKDNLPWKPNEWWIEVTIWLKLGEAKTRIMMYVDGGDITKRLKEHYKNFGQ